MDIEIGPQASSDNGWRKRMRLHQSWWRAARLQVPCGTGPYPSSTSLLGNMLTEADAAAGLNFLSPEAHRSFLDRLAETKVGVDPWRTGHNLLASQPMAFNLFGHLSHRLDLATALFASLVGPDEVAEVTSIEIERLSDALGDHTAFDAFVTYLRPNGSPGFLAIETKLTEPFSQQAYDWPKYLAHGAFSRSVWKTDDPAILGAPKWSQLWRNHLLALAESAAIPNLGEPIVLVVHHPADPGCVANVDGYRKLLVDEQSCRRLDLGMIVGVLAGLVEPGSPDAEWAGRFADRYVRLELSEDELHR